MKPYRVGVLGATGIVGQQLVHRLVDHPWFDLTALAASPRSAGRRYSDAVSWQLPGVPPPHSRELELRECATDAFGDCDVLLSALGADVARELEPSLAATGLAVVSNSSAHRMQPEIPLIIPEVNPDALEGIEAQQERCGGGFVVTNPNCAVIGLALALAPLHRAFGVRRVIVQTMQAVSGAGLRGVGALDVVDNIVPYIPGEEEKIEQELRKILDSDAAEPMAVSAHCHRVPLSDGHLESVSVELERSASTEAVANALREFVAPPDVAALPGSPPQLLILRDEVDRPQPRLDRSAGDGMAVVVGRVRACSVLGIKFVLLSHNAIRGAAGAALLNLEHLAARKLLPRRALP